MGACITLFCTSWGGGSHEPGGESCFHTLVMREGSLEVKWRGASTRGFSLRIDELFLLGWQLADQRVTKDTGRVWRRKIFQDVSSELRAAFQHAEALRHATEIHAYRMGLRLSLATEWGIPFRRPPDTASVAQPQVDEDEVPVASG